MFEAYGERKNEKTTGKKKRYTLIYARLSNKFCKVLQMLRIHERIRKN